MESKNFRRHIVAAFVALALISCVVMLTTRSKPMPNKQYEEAVELMKQKDYGKAISKLNDSLVSGCDPVESAKIRAECYYYMGNHDDDAIKVCESLVSMPEGKGRGWLIRGLVLERQGKKDDAKESYRLSHVAGDVAGMAKYAESLKKGK